jgi:hypothetical protein
LRRMERILEKLRHRLEIWMRLGLVRLWVESESKINVRAGEIELFIDSCGRNEGASWNFWLRFVTSETQTFNFHLFGEVAKLECI